MADENKPPEGGNGNPEGDAAKLKAELESLKAAMAGKDTELAKLESIRKELEDSRQAAKERERKALEEQGQYKTVSEQQKAELDALKAEADAAKKSAEELKAQLSAIVNQQREAILQTIPEGEERDEWKDAELSVLQKIAKHYAHTNGTKPPTVPPPGRYIPGAVDFGKMTISEQTEYALKNNMTAMEIAAERLKAKQKR